MKLRLSGILSCIFSIVIASCGQSPKGTDVGSGGDGVIITFGKARFLAAEMVKTFFPIRDQTATSALEWLGKNKDLLAEDIVESPHDWKDGDIPHEVAEGLSE